MFLKLALTRPPAVAVPCPKKEKRQYNCEPSRWYMQPVCSDALHWPRCLLHHGGEAFEAERRLPENVFIRRVFIATGAVVLAAALFAIAYEAMPVLLLLFLAVLLAVFLRTASEFVQHRSGWRYRSSMLAVMGVICGLIAIAGLVLAPNAMDRISGVLQQMPEVRQRLSQYGWSGLLNHIPGMQDLLSGHLSNIWKRFTQSFSFSETFGPIVSIGLVIIIAIYLAASPKPYVDSFLSAWPDSRRDRVADVMRATYDTLRRWLLGQAVGMLYIALVVCIGLHIIRLPLATTLGIFAGLMAFVPNIGYFLSIAPAILMAVLQSPLTPVWVLILYTAAHWSNDYALIPLVQRRTVHLPPALTLSMQLVMGFLLGGIGLLIATPLLAATLAVAKVLYPRLGANLMQPAVMQPDPKPQ